LSTQRAQSASRTQACSPICIKAMKHRGADSTQSTGRPIYSRKNVPVPAARSGQNYHFTPRYYFAPATISTLLLCPKMGTLLLPEAFSQLKKSPKCFCGRASPRIRWESLPRILVGWGGKHPITHHILHFNSPGAFSVSISASFRICRFERHCSINDL